MRTLLVCSRRILMLAFAATSLVGTLQAVPLPVHAFNFNGNYIDSITGTVSITPEGGAIVGSRHEFDPQPPVPDATTLYGSHNQGLTLTNPGLTNPGVYSIEMHVRYDTINNISNSFPDWLKLIDFKDGSESLGIYYVDSWRSPNGSGPPDQSSVFRFTYAPGGPPLYADSQPVMTPGDWVHLVLTRDNLNQAIGYVNGDYAFTVNDALMKGVFDTPGNVMRFFQGDLPAITEVGGPYYEVGKGGVDFLNIYNEVLTAGDVATLAAAVPEPGTMMLVAVAGLCVASRRRQRMDRN